MSSLLVFGYLPSLLGFFRVCKTISTWGDFSLKLVSFSWKVLCRWVLWSWVYGEGFVRLLWSSCGWVMKHCGALRKNVVILTRSFVDLGAISCNSTFMSCWPWRASLFLSSYVLSSSPRCLLLLYVWCFACGVLMLMFVVCYSAWCFLRGLVDFMKLKFLVRRDTSWVFPEASKGIWWKWFDTSVMWSTLWGWMQAFDGGNFMGLKWWSLWFTNVD